MGAVDTMEVFFEKLNDGDRAGAVALMDERVEMRDHVGDNARTLRGVEQVGGWFLRAEPGLKMIPGEVRDLGITYQADVLSVRPGAPSQHLDASFRVEVGMITRSPMASLSGSGTVSVFAAMSSSRGTSNLLAIFDIVSFALTM